MAYKDYSNVTRENNFGSIYPNSTRLPWNKIWHGIKQRCTNPKNSHYKNYGGRGIKMFITKEQIKYLWFRDRAFSMKVPSIDRIDNDGHYVFENCQFIELSDNVKKSHIDRKK